MKIIKYILIISLLLIITGCNSYSNIEKQQIKQYIEYSNNLIQQLLKNQNDSRTKLQPYRARYRLVKTIIDKN